MLFFGGLCIKRHRQQAWSDERRQLYLSEWLIQVLLWCIYVAPSTDDKNTIKKKIGSSGKVQEHSEELRV